VTYAAQLSHLMLFGQSLAIGFLVGLERERHENAIAGLRTFTLIALAGSLGGYIDVQSGSSLATWALLLLVAASLMIAQLKSEAMEPDTTTVVAALITFVLGYILWIGHPILPAAIAVTMTALLFFRKELRAVPLRLTKQEIISFFQFAAIAIIVLPILPNINYGPYEVLNPYQIGWLVVLISGLSLLGYLALRVFGHKSGIAIAGVLGGMASTTATTLVYAKYSREQTGFSNIAATIILLSHLVQLGRIGIIVGILEFTLIPLMLPWLIGGAVTGGLFVLWLYRRIAIHTEPLPKISPRNPAEIVSASIFAISFAAILFLVAWMNDIFAEAGVFLVSFFSGLTDVDAIAVSNLKLVSDSVLEPQTAIYAIILAYFANLIFKLGIVFVFADKKLRAPIVAGYLVLMGGIASGVLVNGLA
tara:strand:- start:1351 stop:2607 length:1257 start_codon:yes stop_codon:yes gene_type:complete